MIIFETELERLIDVLPQITDANSNTFSINFDYGSPEVLAKYLSLKGKLSFPLIWSEIQEDTNNLREPSVTRNNARIIIMNETQAPDEFNPYQYKYDFDLILQPIADNLLIALENSGISRINTQNIRTQRIPNYSMREIEKSLVYICNAIVITADITFTGLTSCLNQIQFNN